MANYQQNRERNRESNDNCTNVANTDLVHKGTRISNSNTYHYRESTPPSARHQQTTPALPETEADGHMLLQEQTSTNWILETAHKIVSAAWVPQTKRKYKSTFKKWEEFCGERSISTMQTDEINVIQFLTEEYEWGLSFNYLSGYISALKNYLPNHVLDANVIKKFKKGLFKLRLPKTRYHAIWDVNILLIFWKIWA